MPARITAKFNGQCAGGCGKPTLKGSTIEYDYQTKQVWHLQCAPGVGNPREPSDDPYGASAGESAVELAERLHYKPHAEAMGTDWVLLLLHIQARSPATRWD